MLEDLGEVEALGLDITPEEEEPEEKLEQFDRFLIAFI